MDISFSVFFKSIPLIKPYNLSFGPIKTFDTFYVIAKSLESKNEIGIGEITPLPGYNHETVASVTKSLNTMVRRIQGGEPVSVVLSSLMEKAPFAVSGVTVATELLCRYSEMTGKSLSKSIPLAALCDAPTPVMMGRRAVELCSQGFSTLKLKVGQHNITDELARVRSVASSVSSGVFVRLDANQCYNFNQALQLCKGLEGVDNVSFLEQPFKFDQWNATEKLIKETTLPIMLDESIWTELDVDRATNIGARFVKFKLCKHCGIEGSLDLIRKAKSNKMGIIYGNGVQTALGNHYEAIIHEQADIQTATEGNGFLKVQDPVFRGAMSMEKGCLSDQGLDYAIFNRNHWKCVIQEVVFSLDEVI